MLRKVCLLLLVAGCVLVWGPLMKVTGKRVCCDIEGSTSSPTNTCPAKSPFPTSKTYPKSKPYPKSTSSSESTSFPKSTSAPKRPASIKSTFPKKGTSFSKSTSSSSVLPAAKKHADMETVKAVKEMNRSKWPNRTVPYVFHPKFNKKQMPLVNMALDKMRNLTCIRFIDMTGRIAADDPKKHKVVFQSLSSGCFASVGYNKYLKNGFINLAQGCFSPSASTILHELCHTLGIIHTQSRYDRDKYIAVHFDKIQKGRESQFDKRKDMYGKLSLVGLPYDFNSVMHYPTNAFAKESKHQTMTLKKKFPGEVGFSKRLTRSDVATINRMYDCKDHYLGDDIAGAKTYKEWYETYFA